MRLNEVCHRVILGLPRSDRFDIGSQLRRSGISVSANIAEGYGYDSNRAYLHYLGIAQGSLNETETHLRLILRLDLVPREMIGDALAIAEEVGKMLTTMRAGLKRKRHQQTP